MEASVLWRKCAIKIDLTPLAFFRLLKYSPQTKGPSSGPLLGVKPNSLRKQTRARAAEDTSHAHLLCTLAGKYTKAVMSVGGGEGDWLVKM